MNKDETKNYCVSEPDATDTLSRDIRCHHSTMK